MIEGAISGDTDLVCSMRDDFALYVRHYSEGWSGTVMYFVPRAA